MPKTATSTESAQAAAEVLQSYYALIGAGDYDQAFQLREPSPGGPTPEQFAASYAGHAELRASIGTPSEPVESAGALYVEVPVQTYGRLKAGRPFSSAGTVTLKRPVRGDDWRISR